MPSLLGSETPGLLFPMSQPPSSEGALSWEENLSGAIVAWEECLTLNPTHTKAREGADNARHLLEKVQGIKTDRKGEAP